MKGSALWEILTPVKDNSGHPFPRTLRHRWEERVRELAGGFTSVPQVHGSWVAPNGKRFDEPMIPVRIASNKSTIDRIAGLTAYLFHQKAVMYYTIGSHVTIRNFEGRKHAV